MNKRLSYFIIAVAVQLLILGAVPAGKICALCTGKTVILKTAPYDPYTIMSGYYVNLSHEISHPQITNEWQNWPGGQRVWVVLKKGDGEIWNAVSVHNSRPKSVPADCVIIKGKKENHRIVYGIESYFIPEDARNTVESDLRTNSNEARVKVKIDSLGRAALVSLLIQDRVYKY
ncbi:MAG: GDYXXLXY domain-containing protein [Phycisphaerae bacterium]|nr:GDYXXLXY domain-containing protein [Phycisphaerae bacterium]MDD5380164.1 GDYXXLXY domain-containing protein [Phycisphaerae bacterium]